jgi:hypothetical protein
MEIYQVSEIDRAITWLMYPSLGMFHGIFFYSEEHSQIVILSIHSSLAAIFAYFTLFMAP